MASQKVNRRNKIRKRIRSIISGIPTKPRLSVYRSNKEIYAQLIDDTTGKTFVAASSMDKDIKDGNKTERASVVGKKIAEKAMDKGIKEIKFDRGGYLYHGRVKALADGARKQGLKF